MTLFIFLFDSWNYITEYQSIGSSNLFEHLVFIWKWRSLTIGYCLQVDIPVLQSKIHVTLFLALLKLFPPLFYFFKKRDVIYFLKNIYVFLDRGEGWEKDRERNINVWLPLNAPPTGNLARNPGRHVPWLGIEPAILWFTSRSSIHWATPTRVLFLLLVYHLLSPLRCFNLTPILGQVPF